MAACLAFRPWATPAEATGGADEPHHTAEEHSFDRIEEVRRDRIEEPPDAWSGTPRTQANDSDEVGSVPDSGATRDRSPGLRPT